MQLAVLYRSKESLWGILHRKYSICDCICEHMCFSKQFLRKSHSLLPHRWHQSFCVCVSGKQIRREQLNLFASNSPMGMWTLTSVIKQLLLFTVRWICSYFKTKLQKTPVLQKAEQGSCITFFDIVLAWLFFVLYTLRKVREDLKRRNL